MSNSSSNTGAGAGGGAGGGGGGGGHRQKGNEFFQSSNYDEALVAYSKAIVRKN